MEYKKAELETILSELNKQVVKPPKKLSPKAEKLKKVKEVVVEACREAKKIYDEVKEKRNYFTGQIGIDERRRLARAEEKIRSASSSQGGGTMVSLTNDEFDTIVRREYPEYFQ